PLPARHSSDLEDEEGQGIEDDDPGDPERVDDGGAQHQGGGHLGEDRADEQQQSGCVHSATSFSAASMSPSAWSRTAARSSEGKTPVASDIHAPSAQKRAAVSRDIAGAWRTVVSNHGARCRLHVMASVGWYSASEKIQ